MPERRNVFTEAGLDIAQELRAWKDEARDTDAVPIGQERVSAEQMRKRLLEQPALRAQMVKEGRTREILDLFKGKR